MEDNADRLKRLERERYQRNKEARIAYAKAWNKANPEKCREYYRKSYYGKKKNRVQPEEEKPAVPPNLLLGPPVFIFHGKGELIKFD